MARVPLLAVGVSVVVLAGCGRAADLTGPEPAGHATESGGHGPTAGPATAPAPEVGGCRRLTRHDIPPPTNDDPEVACSQPHTAVTYYVGEWPAKLVDSVRGIDDPRLDRYVDRMCERRWRRTVGGSLEAWATSIVGWAWFEPTGRQFADGAHWFRCDLVAGETTSQLETLPSRVDGMLDDGFDDRYHACWTKPFSAKPNIDEGELTSCARPHRQRAIGIVQLGRNTASYPGERTVFGKANDRCGDLVATWRGRQRPGEFGLQWPRRSDWRSGQRHATCWAVTRR